MTRIRYCASCRSLVRSVPPLPRGCRCAVPVVQLRATRVYS